MRVTVLGLGRMGTAIAERLLNAGHSVSVWNRTPGRAAALEMQGALELTDLRDAWRDSDFVISMVADSDALLKITAEGSGLSSAPHGAGATLIDMSTVSAEASTIVAERLQAVGIDYLRAPVSGNPAVVKAGALAILASGDAAVYQRALPLLSDIGPVIQLVGAGESARIVKLALNLIIGGTAELLAESVSFAESHGVDRDVMLAAISASAVGSPFVKYKTPQLIARDYTSTFTTALMYKDLSMALAAADAKGLPLPVTAATRDLLDECMSRGLGDVDFISLLVNLQRRSGQAPDIP